MNELFEWILDYPIIAIGILYLIFRMIFGKPAGDQTQAKQAEKEKMQRERAEAMKAMRSLRGAGKEGLSIQERITKTIAEIERQAQEASMGIQSRPAPQPVEPEIIEVETVADDAAPASGAGGTSRPTTGDPYAFRSMSGRAPERKDYDQAPAAFAYKTAIEEPVDQAFHLKGFAGFHTAHGMSAAERAKTSGRDAYEQQEELESIQDSLDDVESIRRAIIMSEILGKPRSLKKFGR